MRRRNRDDGWDVAADIGIAFGGLAILVCSILLALIMHDAITADQVSWNSVTHCEEVSP